MPRPRRIGPIVLLAGVIAAALLATVWSLVGDDGEPDAETPAAAVTEAAGVPGGSYAQLTGRRLEGIFVSLAEPADSDWTVWLAPVAADAEPLQAGHIGAGQTTLADPDLGLGPLVESYDRVVVGSEPGDPALASAALGEERIDEIRRLLLGEGRRPGVGSLLAGVDAQIDALVEAGGAVSRARGQGELPELRRLAREVLAGAALAGSLAEIRDATAPLTPPALTELEGELRTALSAARRCSDSASVAAAGACAGAIATSAERAEALWDAVAAGARGSVVLELQRR